VPGYLKSIHDLKTLSNHWNITNINHWIRKHRQETPPSDDPLQDADAQALSCGPTLSPDAPDTFSQDTPDTFSPNALDTSSPDGAVAPDPPLPDAVLGIVTSLFSRVATVSGNDETSLSGIVELIADQVYARLLPQTEQIALDICQSCQSEIAALLAPPKPPSRQMKHLAEAREARKQIQIKRNELGAELTRLRMEAAERVLSEPVDPEPLTPILDADTAAEELECSETTKTIYEQYRQELLKLFEIPWECRNRRRYEKFPLSRKLAFLLACHSRPALDIARRFIPLPSYETVSLF
jgi:hypothetical protein